MFCGDGANDVGALKSSLVGLSIACSAEAHIAAPLTSNNSSPGAVLQVVAEGRCSLSAAFVIFRFMMCYAFIQVGVFECCKNAAVAFFSTSFT
jgi:P-type E1-E2 ATPase